MRPFWALAILCAAPTAPAADRSFASYTDVKQVLDAQRANLPPALKSPTEARWSAWARQQDKAIRDRLTRGDLDSMVNLLLYGTSFTKQPRIRMEDLTAASRAGILKARVDDLVAGLRNPGGNERLAFLADLIRGKGMNPETGDGARQTGVFILENLQRVAQEARDYGQRAQQAHPKAGDPAGLIDRESLFSDRGLSLDTSIFPDYSIEQALRDLKNRGLLREGQATRVAVIGPGLDFVDKNAASGFDYYPQQTVQPFAFYDSLLRLELARKQDLTMSIFDISARVLDHIQRARERAAQGEPYSIQLPRDIARPWPDGVIGFWKSLGDQTGAPAAPIQPPQIFQGLETRAVSIRPEVVRAMQPVGLNIVLERARLPEAQRFDLIVATNIFVYYDRFEQMLALENVGAMLKSGALLLTNDKLPELPGGSMKLAGVTDVKLDAIGWYRKQ